MTKSLCLCAFVTLLLLPAVTSAQNPHLVVYQGEKGPGHGKHVVFLAGDHEYRSEESLPALARILAKHYGFKCSVFFTTDPKTGFIEPGSSNIAGLEALKTADLLVIFLRFQDFPDDEMQHIADYLDRGGPVVGFRTATLMSLTGNFLTAEDAFRVGRWSDSVRRRTRFRSSGRTQSSRNTTGRRSKDIREASDDRSSERPGFRTTARITR